MIALIARDLRLAVRSGGGFGLALAFFLIVVTLVPFGVGPEAAVLRRIGPASSGSRHCSPACCRSTASSPPTPRTARSSFWPPRPCRSRPWSPSRRSRTGS